MLLDKGIEVKFGNEIHGTVFGGPFKQYRDTRRLVGIKMAEEIDHPHDFKVDTADFSVPPVKSMTKGLIYGINQLKLGNDLYVGCMGGIGRTGLYMGCMVKVMFDFNALSDKRCAKDQALEAIDPVFFVRNHYKGHAIETVQQQEYVRTFTSRPVLHHLLKLTTTRIPNEPPLPERIIVEKIVYLGPFAWLMHKISGNAPK